jgi:hypothetical protein
MSRPPDVGKGVGHGSEACLPRLPCSLPELACWPDLLPALRVERGATFPRGGEHRRIEFVTSCFSSEQLDQIQQLVVCCAACGSPVQPFRQRRRKSAGRTRRPGRLYVALCCELKRSVGCARGARASRASEALVVAIRACHALVGNAAAPVALMPATTADFSPSRCRATDRLALRGAP